MSLFKTVPSNVVQSIRAFRVADLQAEAAQLGQHFLYAHCAHATTKQQVTRRHCRIVPVPSSFRQEFRRIVGLPDQPRA